MDDAISTDEEYAELYRHVRSKTDVRKLEHCEDCNEPMYLIYKRRDGKRTRRWCWLCTCEREALKQTMLSSTAEPLRLARG